jgi:hypothetical protein
VSSLTRKETSHCHRAGTGPTGGRIFLNTTCSNALRSWTSMSHTGLSLNARQARALLAAGILGYEIARKDRHLLGAGVDEWLASRPILTRTAIAMTVLHLGNALAKRYDVVSLGFQAIRRSISSGRQRSRRADLWQIATSHRTHSALCALPQGPNAIA